MRTRLDPCAGMFHKQLQDLSELLQGVLPCAATLKGEQQRLFLLSVLIHVQAAFESFLECCLTTATFWKPEIARQYLSEQQPDSAYNFASLKVGHLAAYIAKEVDFRKDAKRLRGVYRAILDVDLFADPDTERVCLDLAAVRNIAVHQMARPDEANVGSIRTSGVIVHTATVGSAKFYRLEVSPAFIVTCLHGVRDVMVKTLEAASKNPDLTLEE